MYRITAALLGGFLLAGCANAKEIYTAGDSLCVGLAQAANEERDRLRLPRIKSHAVVGAGTHTVAGRLAGIPSGSTIIVCSGTNDASWRLSGFDRAVLAAIAEAKQRNQKLIWVGPVSTPLWWDQYSDKADTYLALNAPNYISLRAIGWNPNERARDGIHLTTKGYERLWRIVKERL